MRFGQKIFIVSFLLMILFINIFGFIMINTTYKQNIEVEKEKVVAYVNVISSNIRIYAMVDYLSKIANQYERNNMYLEIYLEDAVIYTNLLEKYDDMKELLMQSDDNLKLYIKDQVIFSINKLDHYTIITAADISNVYEIQQEQIDLFIKVSMVTSFLFAFLLYIFTFLITRRIKKLDQASKKIADGNYDIETKVSGKDEIATLSESFQKMTDSVNKNMNEINTISENRQIFINNLTHEIRTPLTSIIGYSSLIKEDKDISTNKILEYAGKINSEGKYIQNLTDKLMEIILFDHAKIKMEPLGLGKELGDIISDFKSQFPDVEIQADIQSNPFIYSDRALLKSLFSNLVKNAISAYEKDAVVRIELDGTQIRVIDNGRGMTPTEVEKIKEPFYTGSKNRNRNISGMGLGMSLCIKIVELHKGSMNIKSKVGVGTMIIVKLGEEV